MKTVFAFFSGVVWFFSEMTALFVILRTARLDQQDSAKSARSDENGRQRRQDSDPLSQDHKQSI
jgi:hypothetical protein